MILKSYGQCDKKKFGIKVNYYILASTHYTPYTS